jgi:hypothetical protein
MKYSATIKFTHPKKKTLQDIRDSSFYETRHSHVGEISKRF